MKRIVGETIGALNSSGLGENFELLSKAMPECFWYCQSLLIEKQITINIKF